MRHKLKVVGLGVAFFLSRDLSRADELADKGREILKKNQSAVVTVRLVLKAKFSMPGMGMPENESKKDATGTVVDPSGLTVLALSALDPGQLVQNMLSGMAGEDSRFKLDTELTDAKILLEDGSELPAEVVLRDKDLDLAFIRPKTKPARPMPALDLTQSGQAQVLDQVVALNRLGQAASRAYAASLERISAIVQRPRLFYVPDSTLTATGVGCPAFTLDGKLLGVFVLRTTKAQAGGGFMSMLNFQQDSFAGIIVPATDILKGARQALEVKPEAKPEAAEEKK